MPTCISYPTIEPTYIRIQPVCHSPVKEMIEPGQTRGGTTIKLPFGFVQWHQGQIQFHHNLDLIKKI